jgi:hypothetical protein
MNKRVLASINNICEELEALGMHKEASKMTDVMAKLAAKIVIFEAAKVRTLDGKIIVEFTNDYWHYRRSQRDFESIEDAKKYARSKAHKVEVYTKRQDDINE